MPSITEDVNAPAKILLIGKSGAGKTGSLASLVAAGYNLRIIDTDKGVRSLRSLLTDDRYPYSKLIANAGVDLTQAVRYVPIDTSMKTRTVVQRLPDGTQSSATLLAPTDAKAWLKVVGLFENWKDDELTLGPVASWGLNDVLVIDSFSTLAKCAYYFSQSLNNRLGARDQGFDYQRDIGEAQAQLTRLLELIYDSGIGCNIIVISHITWVDESQGVASRPKEPGSTPLLSNAEGYPSAIGRALSPQMGKYFNDVYVVRQSGSGESVRRTIATVPYDGVMAKNSVYLEREYPVTYGLAEIFARLRAQSAPSEFLDAFKKAPAKAAAPAPAAAKPLGPKSAASV